VNFQKLLYSPGLRGLVDRLTTRHDVSIAAIQPPEVSDLLCGSLNQTPRAKHSSGLGEGDIVLILHSSGTTGLPKPIYFTLEALAVMDTIAEMPCPPGRRNLHDEFFGAGGLGFFKPLSSHLVVLI
jgi:acyl-CoA synthetase (AMP-forming)/AMP-acid ligase II